VFNPTTVDPLRPRAFDEGPHVPESTPLWNESWYFDFVDPDQRIGGWVRLGLMPNESVAWITAVVSGPHIPTIALLDFEAALPANPVRVQTDRIELQLAAVKPLQEYRVAVRGLGEAWSDPSGLLRGEAAGENGIELSMDLAWTTVGIPYQYRLTPRYEIPCTVSGSVTYGDSAIKLDAVPGQRDHSWGVRDWWGGLEWMWCALHLDDGSHLHAVDARVPGAPNMAIGYIQERASKLVELQTISVQEEFDDSGLPVAATISFDPDGVVSRVEVGGHAPIRLVSSDGQVSHFPRAWVTVTTTDGRKGVGWIEWNRVQSA
jgi:hypothetical protein